MYKIFYFLNTKSYRIYTNDSILVNDNFLVQDSISTGIEINLNNITIWTILIFFFLLCFTGFILFMNIKRQKDKLEKYLNYDHKTGLITLHRMSEQVQQIMKSASNNEYEMITLDIDFFRIINTTFGYEIGTKVIISFANSLKEIFANTNVLVSRVEEEKFIIFRKINELGRMEDICKHFIYPSIIKELRNNYNLSMSVGIYRINDVNEDFNVMFDRTNIARLKGKNYHRLTITYYDKEMKREYEQRTNIVLKMDDALKKKEFVLYYQPKVDFNTLKINGAEALVRWFPKDEDPIYPNKFIKLFEENGFIHELDLYVLEEVCQFLKRNEDKIDIPLISVNVSTNTLSESYIIDSILNILESYDVDPGKIEIEVTESATSLDNSDLINTVAKLREIGFILSMDDFGSGVSSLNRLGSITLDIIKIDKGFLDVNTIEESGLIIVKNIINMLKELNVKIVCEGIETVKQAKYLKALGCDYAQGYFFERPLSENDFITKLESNITYRLEEKE